MQKEDLTSSAVALKPMINNLINHVEIAIKNISNKDTYSIQIKEHYNYIKSFLKQSVNKDQDSIDLDKLYQALFYIENIKVNRTKLLVFNKTQYLANLLPSKDPTISLHYKDTLSLFTAEKQLPIHVYQSQPFVQIHQHLTQALQNGWHYEYSTNDEGEVMNQAIGEWQNFMMALNQNPRKAYKDFTRNINVLDISSKDEAVVEQKIDELVQRSNLPKKQYSLFKSWLEANGGQDMNRFLDQLMMAGAFTEEVSSSLISVDGTRQNWELDNLGNIIFSYKAQVYAIIMDGVIYGNNTHNQLIEISDPDAIKNDKTYHVPALMQVTAKIALQVENGTVRPSITSLIIDSFTNDLKKPAQVTTIPTLK